MKEMAASMHCVRATRVNNNEHIYISVFLYTVLCGLILIMAGSRVVLFNLCLHCILLLFIMYVHVYRASCQCLSLLSCMKMSHIPYVYVASVHFSSR